MWADDNALNRRRFIIGLGAAAALAACSEEDSDSIDPDDTPAPGATAADTATPNGSTETTGSAATSGREGFPTPTGALITRWAQDPFAFGSYSYLSVGSGPDDREALGADVGTTLFFAGEATSTDFAATVHGALLEGRAAATRIDEMAGDDDTILIIGAGAAGLAAARDLTDNGYTVTVVEARDRIGGRVFTDTSLGIPLDLGASWIHGSDGNPLTELATAADVPTATTDEDDITVYDANGDEVDDDVVESAFAEVSSIEGDIDDVLGALLDEGVADLDASTAALVRYAATSAVEHDEAADVGDLTIGSIEFGEEFGGDEVLFPNGYIGVLQPLADGLDIQTGRIVTYVFHGDAEDTDLEVEFADGTTLEPDRVLVTVPLGVLKAGSIEFEPALPTAKLDAIERLGMGVLDKVVLRFDEQFWDDTDLIGFVGNEPGLFIEWDNLTSIVGEPVIMGFNAGTVAREVEQRSDDEILGAALDALRTMYG